MMEEDTPHYLGISFAWSDWDDFGIKQQRREMNNVTLYDILREYLVTDENMEKKMNQTEPKKFWMIVGNGNTPKVRHYNMQDAQTEAARLAKSNPGIEFFIMQTVEMIEQPTGVIRHRF